MMMRLITDPRCIAERNLPNLAGHVIVLPAVSKRDHRVGMDRWTFMLCDQGLHGVGRSLIRSRADHFAGDPPRSIRIRGSITASASDPRVAHRELTEVFRSETEHGRSVPMCIHALGVPP